MTHAAFHFTANSEGSSAQGFADVEKAVADVKSVDALRAKLNPGLKIFIDEFVARSGGALKLSL